MKFMRYFVFLIMILTALSCQKEEGDVLEGLLKKNKDKFGAVLNNPEKYEVQILYTQIDRDSINTPSFNTFSYEVDPSKYFYPASMVKFPIAVLALEKLNTLYKFKQIPVTKNTPIRIDSLRSPQTSVQFDKSSPTGLPTIGHYVNKIFTVSDDDAYNRLYEFLGQNYINHSLDGRGFKNSRIMHRLSAPEFSYEDNKYTNPIVLYNGDTVLYEQKEQYGKGGTTLNLNGTLKGKAFVKTNADGTETVINQPFDFSKKNFMSLPDMQKLLYLVMFPEYVDINSGFVLTEEDYKFLYAAMGRRPRESQSPVYDEKEYYDSYGKFFMYGDTKERMPDNIRIFNKVGWAYGYLTDCAYIVDFENGVEFMLTATIHVNDNETYNDDNYEYEEIGLPFLANLGRVIYDYELKRKRPNKPDLYWYRDNVNY